MLCRFACDSRFLKRAISLRDGQRFAFDREGGSAASFSKREQLRVVNLLYRRLVPLISSDRGGYNKGERYDGQAYEGDPARSHRDPWRGGGHKETSKN